MTISASVRHTLSSYGYDNVRVSLCAADTDVSLDSAAKALGRAALTALRQPVVSTQINACPWDRVARRFIRHPMTAALIAYWMQG